MKKFIKNNLIIIILALIIVPFGGFYIYKNSILDAAETQTTTVDPITRNAVFDSFGSQSGNIELEGTVLNTNPSDGVRLQNGWILQNGVPTNVAKVYGFTILDDVGNTVGVDGLTLRAEETGDLVVWEYGELAPSSGMGLAFYNTQDMRATLVLASTTPDKAVFTFNGSGMIGINLSTTTPNSFFNSCSVNGFDFLPCDDDQFGGDLGIEHNLQVKNDAKIEGDLTVVGTLISEGGTTAMSTTTEVVSGTLALNATYTLVEGEGSSNDDIDNLSGGIEDEVFNVIKNTSTQTIKLKDGTGNINGIAGSDCIVKDLAIIIFNGTTYDIRACI